MILAVLAGFGAIVTLFAFVRLVLALRARAPREVITGWFALMVVPPVLVFTADALL